MTKGARDKGVASPGNRVLRLLPYVGVIVALVILAAPSIYDLIDSWRARTHISSLSSTVDMLSDEEKERFFDQARRHNARLAGMAAIDDDSEELLPYELQLCTDATTMMSWVEIHGIDVRLPVYHGTDDAELSAGVGHLRQSSLPVGGASTHCVLTAHSGMETSRMFDDIGMLEVGDVFVLWTLGETFAYEVTGSEVVLPDQTSSLRIQDGEDLCTLVTCTPYGVNSHRLLVHARRCAYSPEVIQEAPVRTSSRNVPLYTALGFVAGTAVVVYVLKRFRR